MQTLWVATSNQGKLNEFKMLMNREPLALHSQGELPVFSAPPENGDSFLANARIKARALRSVRDHDWVMGEDSGLEVEGLGGLPGIHSARYAGARAADSENIAKLLKMMQIRSATHRSARFVSVIVCFAPDGTEHIAEGVLDGEIAKVPKGNAGFGYDNVFIPVGEGKTLAELGLAAKNRISHRAKAVIALLDRIRPQISDAATGS
jgi:XTP/dITP diphosphohydrolase